MKDGVRLSEAVEWRTIHDFEAHMPVERYGIGVLFVYIDLVGPQLVYGMQ